MWGLKNTENNFICRQNKLTVLWRSLKHLLDIVTDELEKPKRWFDLNKLTINLNKTKFIIFWNQSTNTNKKLIVSWYIERVNGIKICLSYNKWQITLEATYKTHISKSIDINCNITQSQRSPNSVITKRPVLFPLTPIYHLLCGDVRKQVQNKQRAILHTSEMSSKNCKQNCIQRANEPTLH